MAKLTVQNYRDRARTIIGLDSNDLGDDLLDLFLTQGMRYAQRWNQGLWPAYLNTWTATLVADQADYTLTALAANDGNNYTIAHIRTIRSDTSNRFTYLSREDFDRTIARDHTASGNPYVWSPRDSDTIRLYPTTDSVITVDIHGWRDPENWVDDGTGGVSDLPEEFDDAILAYMLGKVYAQQDEGQTSVFWLQMADVHLAALEDAVDQPPPVDMAMNSVPADLKRHDASGRLPFDFEF